MLHHPLPVSNIFTLKLYTTLNNENKIYRTNILIMCESPKFWQPEFKQLCQYIYLQQYQCWRQNEEKLSDLVILQQIKNSKLIQRLIHVSYNISDEISTGCYYVNIEMTRETRHFARL